MNLYPYTVTQCKIVKCFLIGNTTRTFLAVMCVDIELAKKIRINYNRALLWNVYEIKNEFLLWMDGVGSRQQVSTVIFSVNILFFVQCHPDKAVRNILFEKNRFTIESSLFRSKTFYFHMKMSPSDCCWCSIIIPKSPMYTIRLRIRSIPYFSNFTRYRVSSKFF